MKAFSIRGKSVSIHSDGHIFVSGKDTGMKMWSSNSRRYSTLHGSEIKEISGLDLESALVLKGLV